MKYVRTTIVLPEDDVKMIKILAATHNITMSEVIRKSVQEAEQILKKRKSVKKTGWWSVVGSLDLGGKEPPSREELYDRYFKEKSSR
jgi:hypothetical protein